MADRADRDMHDELEFHIEMQARKLMAAGVDEAEARRQARVQFGSRALVEDQVRDTRPAAFLDTLSRDVLYALRSFRRAPLAALTIIATVALGLGLVTVVFTVYNTMFLQADAVRDPGELFLVERATGPGERMAGPEGNIGRPFTESDYEDMRRETTVFADIVATIRPVTTRVDGRRATGHLVTGNFFQALGVQARLGRALRPDDDATSAARPVVVLSHRGWQILFAGDPTAVGRRLSVNGVEYEVVGVMPDGFRGLGLTPPEYWAPFGLAAQLTGAAGAARMSVIGRLRTGLSPEAAAAALDVWIAAHDGPHPTATTPVTVRLLPNQGTIPADLSEAAAGFAPLFFVFGLILLIGCANVANLQLARGVSRQRELGIRLALGASRGRLVRQLLTESLLLALAAATGGLVVAQVFIRGGVYAATAIMPPELREALSVTVPASDWRVVLFLIAGAFAATLLFGLAPALQMTRFEVARAIHGEVLSGARPSRARHALIALQVAASALLVIGAAIFLRSAFIASRVKAAVRTVDTVRVSVADDSRRTALLQMFAADPLVATVEASSWAGHSMAISAGSAPDGREPAVRTYVGRRAVSAGYFALLDIELVSGRGFLPTERGTDAGVVVVSETVARELWPSGNAIGQVVNLELPQLDADDVLLPARPFMVVGVVRDVTTELRAIDPFSFQGVYVPTTADQPKTLLWMRVRGEPERARQTLTDRVAATYPGLVEINTLQVMTRVPTYILRMAFSVTVVLGALALLLTVSGLFSVLSYIVARRTKEIGVRMALGAGARDIATLVLSQSLRPVAIGLTAGGGLAVAVAIALTSMLSDLGRIVHMLDPLAYAASAFVILAASLLSTAIPALRAARLDPIATLRAD